MTIYNDFSAIILAAGYSSRMGDYKPLLRLGRYTAIEHAIHGFIQAGVLDVRVVVGFNAEAIVKVVTKAGGKIVYNPIFSQGMYSSVQAGVASLPQGIQAFFVLPADNPLVSSATVKDMLDYYLHHQHTIVYPTYKGMRGHPPLIAASYRNAIVSNNYNDGLRGFLCQQEQHAYDIAVYDEAVLLDMDTPEDYRQLVNFQNRNNIPTLRDSWKLLCDTGVEKRVKDHSWTVACMALELVSDLNEYGAGLDEELIIAAALLHDISRHEVKHAEVGARLLESLGYPRVAAVVRVHMDIEVSENQPLTEAEVLYLADKMVRESSVVSIDERFEEALQLYNDKPEARQAVLKRLSHAKLILKKVEKVLGYNVANGFMETLWRDNKSQMDYVYV